MIRGIGIDLLETERIQAALKRPDFQDKYYTAAERAMGSLHRLANNFVAKEAVAKALGSGFRRFGPAEIEVLRDSLGKPYVRLYGKARERALRLRIKRIHVSLSDTARYIIAVAIMER